MTPLSDGFVEEMKREFPRFRIVRKRESALSRMIDVILRVLTFALCSHVKLQGHKGHFYTLFVC